MSVINGAHLRGALIRLRREAHERMLEDVAEELGVSQGYLSQLERGNVETSAVLEELIRELELADCRMEVRDRQVWSAYSYFDRGVSGSEFRLMKCPEKGGQNSC